MKSKSLVVVRPKTPLIYFLRLNNKYVDTCETLLCSLNAHSKFISVTSDTLKLWLWTKEHLRPENDKCWSYLTFQETVKKQCVRHPFPDHTMSYRPFTAHRTIDKTINFRSETFDATQYLPSHVSLTFLVMVSCQYQTSLIQYFWVSTHFICSIFCVASSTRFG